MRAFPADYKSALPLSSAAQAGLFAQMPPAALFSWRARRHMLPGGTELGESMGLGLGWCLWETPMRAFPAEYKSALP